MKSRYTQAVETFMGVTTTANPDEVGYREACAQAAEACSREAFSIDEIEHWASVADRFRDPKCDAPTQVASEGGR